MVRLAAVLTVACALAAPAGGQGVRVATDASAATISAGKQVLLEYRHAGVPRKPYVRQLSSPGGRNVLLDAPPDHLHHHGLMFAVGVDGVDFWSEAANCGRQVHRSFQTSRATSTDGRDAAVFVELLDWQDAGGKKLLEEQREVELRPMKEAGATLVTWTSRLGPPEGCPSVKLSGSHYFGLGMRLPTSMNNVAKFFNAGDKTGRKVRGEEYLTDANWCACTGVVEGRPVTVAMFGHPANTRHPATWFTMARPFAYLSATLNLWKQPLTIQADAPLVVRYAVAVWDGQVEPKQIDQLYQAWTRGGATKDVQPTRPEAVPPRQGSHP